MKRANTAELDARGRSVPGMSVREAPSATVGYRAGTDIPRLQAILDVAHGRESWVQQSRGCTPLLGYPGNDGAVGLRPCEVSVASINAGHGNAAGLGIPVGNSCRVGREHDVPAEPARSVRGEPLPVKAIDRDVARTLFIEDLFAVRTPTDRIGE